MVALVGLPGSGKSTLAGHLCARFSLALVDRDAIRADLFPDCRFTDAEKRTASAAVLERLQRHCAAGESCLVDGMTFSRRSEREAVRDIAAAHGAGFLMLWLDCPVEAAVARVDAAPHPAKDRNAALVREVAARFEVPEDVLRLDATLPRDEIHKAAEKALLEAISKA